MKRKDHNESQDSKELAAHLKRIGTLMDLKWNRYLPPAILTSFLGVATASDNGLKGEALWQEIESFVQGVLRVDPTPEQQAYVDQVERRLTEYYGAYEKTVRGVVRVLIDLGLIIMRDQDGQDIVEVPSTLPSPETSLGLCRVDLEQPFTFRARRRNGAGPRLRVMAEDVAAIPRMLNAGWARHLPPDIAQAFIVAASVSVARCTGDLMWDNIEDLWKAHMESKAPFMPRRVAEEVETRFAQEYGKPYERSARGAIAVLLDLGLLVKIQLDGQDFLEVPDILPSPDSKLVLSEEEKEFLRMRQQAGGR